MKIDCRQIKTIGGYLRVIQQWKRDSTNVMYRGQRRDWKLIPGIARKECLLKNMEAIRREFSLRLPMFGHAFLATMSTQHHVDHAKEWFELIVGQHHGLPTRLLDFTGNPLTALFFALIEGQQTQEHDAGFHIVWCVRYQQAKIFDSLLDQKPGSRETCVFHPPIIDSRISSQQALFVCFQHPELALEQHCSFHHTSRELVYIPGNTQCSLKFPLCECPMLQQEC